ncbi:hypothetical protein MHB43_29205 [Paenibacillus sp. FSL H8-0317]
MQARELRSRAPLPWRLGGIRQQRLRLGRQQLAAADPLSQQGRVPLQLSPLPGGIRLWHPAYLNAMRSDIFRFARYTFSGLNFPRGQFIHIQLPCKITLPFALAPLIHVPLHLKMFNQPGCLTQRQRRI